MLKKVILNIVLTVFLQTLKKKCTLIVFTISICLLVSLQSFSQEYGLKFQSTIKNIEERTSFVLIEQGDFTLKSNFRLTFDFDLYNLKEFGYICSLIDENDDICVIFSPNPPGEFVYFDVVIKGQERLIRIPFPRENLKKKRWHKLNLSFLMNSDSIKLSVDDYSHTTTYPFKQKYIPEIVFGFHKTDLSVPSLSIKDIKLVDSENQSLIHFPLDEFRGDEAADVTGQNKIKIIRPAWLAKEHYYWKFIKDFNTIKMADYCYIPTKDEIWLVGSDSVIIYSIAEDSLYTRLYKNQFPVAQGHYNVSFNPIKNRIDIYVFNESVLTPFKGWISSLDLETMSWEEKMVSKFIPVRRRHNVLYFEDYDYPVVFGGYGNRTYFNNFLTYNPDSLGWIEIDMKGRSISPRFLASMSQKSDSVYYLYGGFGNQSGEQIMGGKNNYDLYEINTKEKLVKKIFELPNPPEEFVGANTMVYIEEEDALYILGYGHHIAKTHLCLYRVNIKEPRFEIVGDSIPVTSLAILSKNNLFYSKSSEKLITTIREYFPDGTSSFRIYSLHYPPINRKVITQPGKNERPIEEYWYIIVIAGLASLSLIWWFFIRKKVKAKRNEELFRMPEWTIDQLNGVLPDRNVLLFSGTFKAINRKGQDITHLFSPRLLQLLYLIIVSTHKSGGISSQGISNILWPDKEVWQSKNIRSVTFNHLRKALEDIDGVEIVSENKLWKIDTTAEVFVDMIHFFSTFDTDDYKIESLEENSLLQFLAYITRGNFGQFLQNDWIENYKFEIDSKVIDILFKITDHCWLHEKNNVIGLLAANSVLRIAPFNEEAIQFKIKFLVRMGKLEAAKTAFKRFLNVYDENFGQIPDLNFAEIANLK